MTIAILLVLAYLIGSIPSAVWISKSVFGIDIREHGSGNAGATNTFRILGSKAGSGVMLMDMLKGFIAVKLALFSRISTRAYIPYLGRIQGRKGNCYAFRNDLIHSTDRCSEPCCGVCVHALPNPLCIIKFYHSEYRIPRAAGFYF